MKSFIVAFIAVVLNISTILPVEASVKGMKGVKESVIRVIERNEPTQATSAAIAEISRPGMGGFPAIYAMVYCNAITKGWDHDRAVQATISASSNTLEAKKNKQMNLRLYRDLHKYIARNSIIFALEDDCENSGVYLNIYK
jgi:hypothetical protein